MKNSKLKTTEYAKRVVEGKIIASKKVILACKRHLNDLKRQGTDNFPWVFNEEKGYRPIAFIEKFCKPSKGDFQKLEMQPWQHFVIGQLGWVHKDTGLRKFSEIICFVSRKNGKSTMVSGLANYFCSKDGEKGSDVYLLANSMKQARVIFDECAKMIKSSKQLSKHFRVLRDSIHFDKSFSKIEPQASDSEKLDGLNSHYSCFDEISEYKNWKLINIIKNSTAARKQPVIMYISTMGYVLDGAMVDIYEKATDVLNGVFEDERAFYFIAEIDPEDDINDIENNPQILYKANPNLGITIDPDTMLEEWKTRKHVAAERNDFITKRLNVFVKSDEQSFLDFEVIKRNNKVIQIDNLKGKECIGAFDLGATEDFCSACCEFILEDGQVFVLSHSWIPRKKVISDNEKIPYEIYEKEGLLTICDGEYVDYTLVYDWFIEQSKKYQINKIAYDPANAFRLVNDLKAFGFDTEVVRQGHLTLSPAVKDAKELFLDGKVIFNNNKLFRWYINNVKLVEDRNGNWLPTKQGKYRKIDGFAAFLNAHSHVMHSLGKVDLNKFILSEEFSF